MAPPAARPGIAGLRWWIAGLIFLATLINFVNRLTISVLAPVIMAQLRLSNLEFASITNCFLIAYTISQSASGKLYDRLGNRRGFTISIAVWSVASMLHAFATGLVSLNVFRFLLGLGEAGNWPGAAKVITEWFPARQRALGMAIFNSGTSIGSVLAPPLIIWLEQQFGWQATFLAVGALGFVWLILWLAFYRAPGQHPRITPEEYALLTQDADPREHTGVSWTALLRYRQTWALVVARFFADPVWWLYITWLPLFLYKAHGFSLKEIGAFSWLPFVAADAGSLFGGWASGYLVGRGWTANRARKSVIVLGMLCMSTGILAAQARSAAGALAWIAVVLFGFQSWINNVQTLPSDYFPGAAVGSVAGMGGTGAGVGAILFTWATGFVADHFHSYTPILAAAGLLPVLGTAALFVLGGPIRRLSFEESKELT
ncbi:MAG: MFS transporter [Acidobacteria bacterium]|nr:MFS transporter [Acidobacteriota bacterium]